MEELLQWIVPILLPLIISISIVGISSKRIIQKAKEETAKEIAAFREETEKEIAKVHAETAKELEIIKAQTEKEITLFHLQQQAKKEAAQNEIVNQLGGQVVSSLLTSSLQGKTPAEMKAGLEELQHLAEELKKMSYSGS